MTNQYVTITVTEDDKTLTITHEKLYEWPGQEIPHISKMIDKVAEQAKDMIFGAEADAAKEVAKSEPF